MDFIFLPVRYDGRPEISVSGEILTIDGEEFDFSEVPPGATLPQAAISSEWIGGDVSRNQSGVLSAIPILLSIGANAPDAARFPEPITVTEGPVVLPPYDEEPEA